MKAVHGVYYIYFLSILPCNYNILYQNVSYKILQNILFQFHIKNDCIIIFVFIFYLPQKTIIMALILSNNKNIKEKYTILPTIPFICNEIGPHNALYKCLMFIYTVEM